MTEKEYEQFETDSQLMIDIAEGKIKIENAEYKRKKDDR